MATDTRIAARLREARVSCGYQSAAEAADAMDLPFSSYQGHENGNRGIPLNKLRRYAAFFRVNLLWLAEGRGQMRGKGYDTPDILEGLSPEGRQKAIDYIDLLKLKERS